MKEIDFENIARKLKDVRVSKGLTQEYIANMADVNTSHISNIENNRVKISLSTLVHVCNALNVYVCNALNVTVDSILSDEYNTPVSVLEHEILLEVQSFPLETQKQILKIIRALH